MSEAPELTMVNTRSEPVELTNGSNGAQHNDPEAACLAFAEAVSCYNNEDLLGARRLFMRAMNLDGANERYRQRVAYLDDEIQDIKIKAARLSQGNQNETLSRGDRLELARLLYLLGERQQAWQIWKEIAQSGHDGVAKAARKYLLKKQF